jgi:hypothetical protein
MSASEGKADIDKAALTKADLMSWIAGHVRAHDEISLFAEFTSL